MPARWRRMFAAYAETPEHASAVAEAKRIIRHALTTHRQPYVAFSGGKDSTCVLAMVLAERPDAMVLHWDYGTTYIPRVVHREIVVNAEAMGAQLRIETSPLYDELGDRAINVLGRHMIGRLLPQLKREGYDVAFVGLRREESGKRKRRMNAGEAVGPIPECWPVASWRWLDVWAYIVSHDLPYLSLYDERATITGYDQSRFTTLFDPEFAKYSANTIDGLLHWRIRGK